MVVLVTVFVVVFDASPSWAANVTVSGVVTDTNNLPVADVAVTLTGAGGTATNTTGSDGAYSVSVAAGSYTVSMTWHPFDSPSLQSVTVTGTSIQPVNFAQSATEDILFASLSSVNVGVKNELGAPVVANISLGDGQDVVGPVLGDGTGTLYRFNSYSAHDGPTNPQGHRAFAVLTHDTIPVTVAASGYLTKTTNVSVDGDEIVTVTLQTPAPGSPTIMGNTVAWHESAVVSWSQPAFAGGSPITGYVVTPYIGYFPLTPTTFNSTATTQVMTGLTDGETYRFRVQAINSFGSGPYSKVTNAVTPHTSEPAPPTIILNATAGDQSATVSWTAPFTDGGSPLTGYIVTPYIGYFPLVPTTFNSTDTTQVVTGLTNGTSYRFRVQATNALGTSGYSKVTNAVTPS
jgi:hypothetical protein